METMREKIKCDCGAVIQRNSYQAHLKSKKHNQNHTKPRLIHHEGKVIVSFN